MISECKDCVYLEVDHRHLATIVINRPEKHNAFDDEMIEKFIKILDQIEANKDIRCVLLRSIGDSFSAGADLNWMKKMTKYTEAENLKDAMRLAELLHKLYRLPRPLIAAVHGPAFGGGVGLLACCDVVIASEEAQFCLSEVKLGLIPALISPYMIAAMGPRACQRYFMTGEHFSAERAFHYGLVHEVTSHYHLYDDCEKVIDRILKSGPVAVCEAKQLVRDHRHRPIEQEQHEELAGWISRLRVSKEAQEGMKAFLEKRYPEWPSL